MKKEQESNVDIIILLRQFAKQNPNFPKTKEELLAQSKGEEELPEQTKKKEDSELGANI